MTAALDQKVGPWTEDEYFALGESSQRIELFDGSLVMTPAPSGRHQQISRRLANAVESSADPAGLCVVEAVNVRLSNGRIAIPDIVVTPDDDQVIFESDQVALVCEIVSPSNAGTDRVLKMHLYALAGIPWYLIVEQEPTESLTLRLFRLDGDKYLEHLTAHGDETLTLTEPFPIELRPNSLLGR